MGKHSAPRQQRTPGKLSVGARASLAIAVVAVPTMGAGLVSGAATSVASELSGQSVERSVDGEQLQAKIGPMKLFMNCYNPVFYRLLKCRGPLA